MVEMVEIDEGEEMVEQIFLLDEVDEDELEVLVVIDEL